MEYPEAALRALLGQAVGDAFGAPFEYNRRAAEMAMRSMAEERYLDAVKDVGNRAKWARIPGLYTDDTQQAIALLHACSETDDWLDGTAVGDAFIEIVSKMYEAWVPGSLAGVHRGTGKNFREVARNRTPVHTAGLGAAMRIGPAAIMQPSMAAVLPWSVRVSQVTTSHPLSLTTAAIFAAHCHAVAHQQEDDLIERLLLWLDAEACTALDLPRWAWLEPLRAIAVFEEGGEKELLAYAQQTGFSTKPLSCAANGFALTGLPWVLHHAQADSFPDALLGACSSGGDCDTVAAMVGCISILRHGMENIPVWMCDQLVGLPLLLDPHAWHPIHSELPLTQREETHRREALLQEFETHMNNDPSEADDPLEQEGIAPDGMRQENDAFVRVEQESEPGQDGDPADQLNLFR